MINTDNTEFESLAQFLEKLEDVAPENGHYRAMCPAHTGNRPALTATVEGEVGNRKILVHCHAGCGLQDILDALELTKADLFERRNGKTHQPQSNLGPIVATYDYVDAAGDLVLQVTRHDPKDFRQRRPVNGPATPDTVGGWNDHEGWVWSIKDIEPVLYNLREVRRAVAGEDPVYVLEGEKDCDRAKKELGNVDVAWTTCPMGSGKWRPSYTQELRGAHVWLIPDNDEPGHKHMNQVAKELLPVAKSVHVIDLPNVPEGGDLSDWLDAGGTHEEFDQLTDTAPLFFPHHKGTEYDEERKPFSLSASEFVEEAGERADWVVEGILAKGSITSLAGLAKYSGKTTYATHMVKCILAGNPFLGRTTKQTKIVYATEQGNNFVDAMRKADLLDADPDSFRLIPYRRTADMPWPTVIEKAMEECEHYGADCLIVDTFAEFAQIRGTEENNSGDISEKMEPLKKASRVEGLAVGFTRHAGKDGRARGSSQFEADVDIVIELKRGEGDSKDTERKVESVGRYDAAVYKETIELTENGYVSHGYVGASSTLIEAKGETKKVLPTEKEKAIPRKKIWENLEVAYEDDEEGQVPFSEKTLERAIDELLEAGEISRYRGGGKGNPWFYWRPEFFPHQTTSPNDEERKETSTTSTPPREYGGGGGEHTPHSAHYITDPDRMGEVVEFVVTADVLGVDIETTGLDSFKDKVRLLQVARSDDQAYVLDADKVDITPIVRALNDVPVVLAHNMKFEASFLMPYGFKLGSNTYCTQLLHQILTAGESQQSDLRTVAKRMLGLEIDKTHQSADWSGEVSQEMVEYAAKDASVLPDIYKELTARLKKAGNLERTIDLEMQTLKATVEMTRSGLPADEGKLKEYIAEARDAIVDLRNCMDTYVTEILPEEFIERNRKNKDIPESRNDKVNWQASEQIAWAFKALDVELPLTKKGNPSTSKEALEAVDHPLAEKVLELNKLKTVPTKWQNAIDNRLYNGRLYADWKQLGAASGRYSCAKPPLQGIPKSGTAKSCFVAPEGYRFVSSDLSQIEVRVWAAISGDEKLIGDFKSSELDLYRSVAERIFDREVSDTERDAMKAIVLGRLYGMGARSMQARLQRILGRPVPEKEVRGYIDELASAYPKAEQWRKDQETEDPDATTNTRTMNGRLRRKVTSNPQRFNTPIQGSAADVLKNIAVAVVDEIVQPNSYVELCALIHDEVVLLVEEARAAEVGASLTEVMERVGDTVVNGDNPPELRVPITADTSEPKKSLGSG